MNAPTLNVAAVHRLHDEKSVANDYREPGVPGTWAQAADRGRRGLGVATGGDLHGFPMFDSGRLIFSFHRADDVVARYDIGLRLRR